MAAKNIESFPGEVEVTSNLAVNTNTLHVDSVTHRVGIGKTDPGYTMDVNGTVNATALYVGGSEFAGGGGPWTASGSDIYNTGGNVGIGLTNPVKKLQVASPVRMSNGGTANFDFTILGREWTGRDRVTGPDGYYGDTLGGAEGVSMSGDGSYLIAGAYYDDDTYSSSGSAYIFVRSGTSWAYQAKLVAPDPGPSDFFGYSVSISGDGSWALVGTYRDENLTGAVYAYVRSGSSWSYQQKIVAPDAAVQDRFGQSVSISSDGSYALVGSIMDDDNVANSGSGYIFVRSGTSWSLQQKIYAPDPGAYSYYGQGVSISGNGSYAAVGAMFKNYSPTYGSAGAVYVYLRSGSTWSYQATLYNPDHQAYSNMGRTISISSDGSYLAANEWRYSTPDFVNLGSAHVFVRSGTSWSHQARFLPPDEDRVSNLQYAINVNISGDGTMINVGANRYSSSKGALYSYVRFGNTWLYDNKIIALASPTSRFGECSATSNDGTYVAVSEPGVIGGYIQTFELSDPCLGINSKITADGTLLSFTGQHICFPEGPMEQGLVVSANKNKYVSLNGPLVTGSHAIRSNESLPVVSLSNVANDGTVFGVVDHFEQSGTTRIQESGIGVIKRDKEVGDNRVVVNSLGEGAIWVANTNGNVASGDLLTTSHLPGYAQKQDDNIFRNRTVAKSTMDCNFDPEDVPARIVLKDEGGNNVLDSYGRIQWMNHPDGETTPEYNIRYLDVSGTPTDEANAVHIAAYVGCTYHCG